MFEKHGYRETKMYSILKGIKQRCFDEKIKQFKDYGGRGITMCEEWKDTKTFVEWALNNGYKDGLEIDRINNDGNYEPSNCRFVTKKDNNGVGRKRKSNRNTSGFVGVSYNKRDAIYYAYICVDSKPMHLGSFKNVNDAVISRIKKEIEIFGEQKTNLNFGIICLEDKILLEELKHEANI